MPRAAALADGSLRGRPGGRGRLRPVAAG